MSKLKWIESESSDPDEREFQESLNVLSRIRQIIDCACDVGETNSKVVRHVIAKLQNGYESFRMISQADRRKFIEQSLVRHRANFKKVLSDISQSLD